MLALDKASTPSNHYNDQIEPSSGGVNCQDSDWDVVQERERERETRFFLLEA